MSRIDALKYYKLGLNSAQGTKESQYFFDLSIASDPTFYYSYFEKSVPYNKRGDYAEGFKLLNKAVELNPKMHLGYRGWLRLVKLKDYRGCISDLTKLQKIKSKNKLNAWGQNINYLLGISYLGLKDYNEAVTSFDRAINENHNRLHLESYFFKGIVFSKTNDYDKAILNLKLCVYSNEKFTEAFYHLGLCYYKIFDVFTNHIF